MINPFRRRKAPAERARECKRCSWIRSQPAEELIFIWRPGLTPEQEKDHGEHVRTLALLMHASDGHPDTGD